MQITTWTDKDGGSSEQESWHDKKGGNSIDTPENKKTKTSQCPDSVDSDSNIDQYLDSCQNEEPQEISEWDEINDYFEDNSQVWGNCGWFSFLGQQNRKIQTKRRKSQGTGTKTQATENMNFAL